MHSVQSGVKMGAWKKKESPAANSLAVSKEATGLQLCIVKLSVYKSLTFPFFKTLSDVKAVKFILGKRPFAILIWKNLIG